MENPLSEPLNENGEQKILAEESDNEADFFKEKVLSDSLANNFDNKESRGKGREDGSEGLVSFASLKEEPKEVEISLDSSPPGIIQIKVDVPKKSTEGMSAHLVYPVFTKSTMTYFKSTSMSTSKRFNDFLILYDHLVSTHLPLGVVIPLPPEKDMIGMTKMKITKDEELNNMDFVERRRSALERFLNKIASHPSLVTDKFFVAFLQGDEDYSKSASSGGLGEGIAKWFGKVGESFTKITSALPESDQWYEDKQETMECAEARLKELLLHTEAYLGQRKELGQMTNQLSNSVSNMGSTEKDMGLSKILSALAEAVHKTEELRSSHSLQPIIDCIKDNLSFVSAIRLCMNERHKQHKVWKDSENTLKKKTDQKTKLENQKKSDKLEYASIEIHEWQEKVKSNKESFELVSKNIKTEIHRLDKQRVKDIKDTLLEVLQSNIEQHKATVDVWEKLILKIKNEE